MLYLQLLMNIYPSFSVVELFIAFPWFLGLSHDVLKAPIIMDFYYATLKSGKIKV